DPHVSKTQRAPLLIHRMLPIDDLPPECALIGYTLTVGRGSRKTMLLGVFAHRAVGEEARRQSRHAPGHPPTPSRRPAIGLRPPAIQFRQIDAAIDEHFHAACAAG